jgi:hypothetical protein
VVGGNWWLSRRGVQSENKSRPKKIADNFDTMKRYREEDFAGEVSNIVSKIAAVESQIRDRQEKFEKEQKKDQGRLKELAEQLISLTTGTLPTKGEPAHVF